MVLFETEQEMMDIPFGDTFKVVLRWEFHQHDESVPEVRWTAAGRRALRRRWPHGEAACC